MREGKLDAAQKISMVGEEVRLSHGKSENGKEAGNMNDLKNLNNSNSTKNLRELLSEYNSIFKMIDKSYHDAARAVGLSDGVFWILYTLREAKHEMTQTEIVNIIQFPPQTINSALMKLKAEGSVEFRTSRDRRKKLVCLTEEGIRLAEKTVDRIMYAEMESMGELSSEEQELFLGLFKKHTNLLKESLARIGKDKV